MRTEGKVFCNRCKKEFTMDNGIIQEGIFNVEYLWGYFSKKDSEIHSFDICEECYNEMVSEFAIPVTIEESNEVI